MKVDITHAMAHGLWQHFHERYYTALVDRYQDDEMAGVRQVLDLMGLRGHGMFLRSHALTIIDVIYIPFAPGQVSEQWHPVFQAAVAIHEHHHVLQAELSGAMGYIGSYLTRRDARASYEADALRTNMEFGYWLSGVMPDPGQLARGVLAYGCDDRDAARVQGYLERTVPVIESGEVLSETVRVATDWLTENTHRSDG